MMITNYNKDDKTLGLYVHIPFCQSKCKYCDFLSFERIDDEIKSAYIEALNKDIRYSGALAEEYLIDSIFIGGGTPSLLEGDKIAGILYNIYNHFRVDRNAEITLEANPKTLTAEKLSLYFESGINRLSLGVQSMNEHILSVLGRIHRPEHVIGNYQQARNCGFNNINMDLMFSIPGQTLEIWLDDLDKILALGPEHISFYSLQIEKGTAFDRMLREGKLTIVDDDIDRKMYRNAVDRLKGHGFHHYEFSNAAKPGKESRHNLKYWSMAPYLGIGLGAHSYMCKCRFGKEDNLLSYIKDPVIAWKHENTRQDEISEYIFTGLRRIDGISLEDFQERYKVPLTELYNKQILKHIKAGLIEIDNKNKRMKLTDKGIDVSNIVFCDFV